MIIEDISDCEKILLDFLYEYLKLNPEDYFYDICDELGLVIWQDFMFACANYRLTEEFEENITLIEQRGGLL